MTSIRSSAPGKAVISGEYAVLGGAPALSMALDRRARVHVLGSDSPEHVLSAPGFSDGPFRFRAANDSSVEWLDALPAANAFALFEAVWRCVGVSSERGLVIELDTREFADVASGMKLGIGSSAALAVALTAALMALPGAPEWQDRPVADCALAAHRAFQNGKGSGVDVATAIAGGLIAFRRNADARPLCLPDGLHYHFFWSGRSAKTASKIDALAIAENRAGVTAADRDLIAAAESLPEVIAAGSAVPFLAGLQAFVQALSNFDQEHGLGIFAAGHRALADFAQTCRELVYKPCGAGGGDIGVAMSTSTAALQRFARRAVAAGFVPVDAHLEARGVLVEAG